MSYLHNFLILLWILNQLITIENMKHSSIAIILIVAALALGIAVVVKGIILPALEVEARRCSTSWAFNANQGRRFGHWWYIDDYDNE
jgi:hypothetical protein